TFQELLDTTAWKNYGRKSGNPRCRDCMVHSGYEPTAVQEMFGSLRGIWAAAKSVLFGVSRPRATTVKVVQPNSETFLPILSNAQPAARAQTCSSKEPNVIPVNALFAESATRSTGQRTDRFSPAAL